MIGRGWVLVVAVLLGAVSARAQQYSFEEVASGLKHQDATTRLRAIQILKDADYAEAAVPIAAAMEDRDDRVQMAALDAERALFTMRPVSRRRKIGLVIEVRSLAGGDIAVDGQLALKARTVPPQVLNGVAVALRDNNPRVRAEAITLAALLAPAACAPGGRDSGSEPCSQVGNGLIDNINSRDAALRRAAMQSLGHLRYANAVQALSDQLSFYQSGPDAEAALEGLAGIGHPTSASIFSQMLTGAAADVRRFAVEGIARSGSADALPALQEMGQSERSNRVLLAIHYAGIKLGGTGSSPQQLIAVLGDASLRPVALKYLLDLAPAMAPQMADALRDPDPDVRRLVADVLGFSRDVQILPGLEAATTDADPDVALAAERAIARINLR